MPQQQPYVIVLGGPNGAGKTTAAEAVLHPEFGIAHFVNADTLARGLSRDAPGSVAMEAGRLMLQRLRDLREARISFAFESTLAGRAHARFLQGLRSEGWWVELLYVSLQSVELSAARVAARVEHGGHNIPPADVKRRFGRSLKNLFELYIPLADEWKLVDNSDHRPASPIIVATGGLEVETEVHDEYRYRRLRAAAAAEGRG